MPAFIDYAYNYTTVTNGTTIAVDVPDAINGDLLIALMTSDTGVGVFTSAGWTSYTNFTTTTPSAHILWRIANAEPVSYTFTTTVGETLNGTIISIRDIDAASPFAANVRVTRASHNTAFGTVSTAVANNLLLFFSTHGSPSVTPSILEGPVIQVFSKDGAAHSDAFAWGFQSAAGTTPNNVLSSVTNTTYGGNLITIAIKPPTGGATIIPTYCAGDLSTYIRPLHGTTAFRGNTAPASTNVVATITGTIGGKTLAAATVSAATDKGINTYRPCTGQTSSTNRNWNGLLAAQAAAITTMAGKNILCHSAPTLPIEIQTMEAIGLQRGVAMGLYTSAGNFKVWHVHGANTAFGVNRAPVVINTNNTSGLLQTTGTLNANSIAGFALFTSGFVVSSDFIWTMIWGLDTTTICGGNAAYPVKVPGIVNAASNGKERMSMLQQGKSQMLVLQPFQLGDGTRPTYVDLSAAAVEFPEQYNLATGQVFYCSADNVAGITLYPAASDTINLESCTFSSASKYHWIIHASASTTATWMMNGMTVIGAGTVTYKAGVPIIGCTFNKCSEIPSVGATITSVTFSQTTAVGNTGAVEVSSPANMALITNCTFLNNTSFGLRLSSATAQSYNFDKITFSGNTKDVYIAATTGTVTLNILNNGTTPTYTSAGATVVINNAVTLSVTVNDVGTGLAVQNARVIIKKVSDGTVVLTGLTDVNGQLSTSYSFTVNTSITGGVRRATVADGTLYKPSSISGTITTTGFDSTILMIPDE